MKALEAMRRYVREPRPMIDGYKALGKKIIGYRCLYVPEEIIHAAGMVPYPLFGGPEPISLADSYLQPYICEFIRNVFDRALDGKLNFLDGLVLCNTCDAVRKLYDHWRIYIKTPLCYMINNPQETYSSHAYSYYYIELQNFRQKMENFSGQKITDENLAAAISLYNETRSLLKKVYFLRKQDPAALSGAEALDMVMAAMIMPKEEANTLIREVLKEAGNREDRPRIRGPRILITGSIIDQPALIRLVEEMGGVVAADDLCTTSRYFWQEVKGDNPMDALCLHTTQRCLCPCMHPAEKRLAHLQELIREFAVEGVIYFNLKYCDPFIFEGVMFKERLEKAGIPVMVLEAGHDLSGVGQLKTRVQAFIEMFW